MNFFYIYFLCLVLVQLSQCRQHGPSKTGKVSKNHSFGGRPGRGRQKHEKIRGNAGEKVEEFNECKLSGFARMTLGYSSMCGVNGERVKPSTTQQVHGTIPNIEDPKLEQIIRSKKKQQGKQILYMSMKEFKDKNEANKWAATFERQNRGIQVEFVKPDEEKNE